MGQSQSWPFWRSPAPRHEHSSSCHISKDLRSPLEKGVSSWQGMKLGESFWPGGGSSAHLQSSSPRSGPRECLGTHGAEGSHVSVSIACRLHSPCHFKARIAPGHPWPGLGFPPPRRSRFQLCASQGTTFNWVTTFFLTDALHPQPAVHTFPRTAPGRWRGGHDPAGVSMQGGGASEG